MSNYQNKKSTFNILNMRNTKTDVSSHQVDGCFYKILIDFSTNSLFD